MELQDLVQKPEAERNDHWEALFLDRLAAAKVELVSDQPITGPDGWPYMSAKTSFEGAVPVAQLVHWAADKGVGLVVNAHKMVPDYVFTYGMLWCVLAHGRFVMPQGPARSGPTELGVPGQILGAPTERYLPKYVRSVLREYLSRQGFLRPRIAVATTADFSQTDLVFANENLNNLGERDQKVMAEALSWFLPLHYSLVIAPEAGLKGFVDL